MLVPLSWLREFVPYEGSPEELGARLTMLGLELEGINHPFAALEPVKVGFVAQCIAHPDSDHLHCCKVDLGAGELVDIVCGAPNVAAGQKVAVISPGSRLPDGTLIKKVKLRGQPSYGMICSERELGLSEDHAGILVLPDSCDVGKSLLDALNLERDVLDLSITPNRPDCLSIIGVARETALAYGLPFSVPELPLIPAREPGEELPDIEIVNPDFCRLYAGRMLRDMKITQSPMRLRYRLHAVGIRAISNIVDITNYILFETGQPLHAFDLSKLSGRKIIVSLAGAGGKLTTLDGKERLLTADDLVICDAEKPVALAGIMGGEDSEITSHTNAVFLESAVFNPRSIRKTAKRLALNSEASFRFERGIDQRRSIWALDRACAMMASIAGAKVAPDLALAEPRPFIPARITYRPARCDLLLGCAIPAEAQAASLENDGCAVEKADDTWIVIQPSWRPDLTREADLVEEVARIYGVDKIPVKLPPVQKDAQNLGVNRRFEFQNHIRQWAAGIGLHEAINYSFTAKKEIERLNPAAAGLITLSNPLSEDQDVLRDNLAPGLLWDLQNNLAHGTTGVRLFEIANAFCFDPKSETLAQELPRLAILLSGNVDRNAIGREERVFGYADIKGVVENLSRFLLLSPFSLTVAECHSWLNPAVEIWAGEKQAGWMGRVKPELAKNWNAQKQVWICELDLEVLEQLSSTAQARFQSLPVFPPVRRDMTVMAQQSQTVSEILNAILQQKLPLLEGVELVDVYSPAGSSEKNLTFRLTFRHSERTLKDEEADREREKVADYLRKNLSVRV